MPKFGHFRTVNPVWIHIWLRNDAQSLKLYMWDRLLHFKVICKLSISHETKNYNPNWPLFRVYDSSLNSRMTWNNAQSWKWHRRGSLLFCKVIHPISRSHGTKVSNFFNPRPWNLTYDLDNQHGTSSMLLQAFSIISKTPVNSKWRNVQSGNADHFAPIWAFPNVFRGNPYDFKVTRAAKSTIWIWFGQDN